MAKNAFPISEPSLSDKLLDWYDHEGRNLPWRVKHAPNLSPSDSPPQANPYHVWLSEIMLQQTTVAAVIPYFHDFLSRWPDIKDLATADLDAVLHAWQGLGYYARARNLHKCARVLMERYDGQFPDTEEGLRTLPGVGDYTAAAIAAIAFQRPANVVDGNVERVIARLFAITEPMPGAKAKLKAQASSLCPEKRPGDYAQALMDLGATLCTPRNPKCILCPWSLDCAGRIQGLENQLPAKTPKPERPTRYGMVFWIIRDDGSVLLRRRAEKGLLGGMIEVPSTEWRDALPWTEDDALLQAPLRARWRLLPGVVRHSFTHFHLELSVMAGFAPKFSPVTTALWVPPEDFEKYAFPSVMKKVIKHALRKL